MSWFLGKSMQKGGFITEQNFHGLWDKFAGFYPAWMPMEAFPCRNPGTELPVVQTTSSEAVQRMLEHPSQLRGLEPSLTVKHMLMLLINRNGFNDALMITSIVASVYFLQIMSSPNGTYPSVHSHRCGTLSLLCSLASVYHLFLYSYALYTPLHFIAVLVRGAPDCGPAPGVMHPMGWVLWEHALANIRLCKLSQGPASTETWSISSSREGCKYVFINHLAD